VKVGVVREIKVHENRVALTPAGAERLVASGHEVMGRDPGGSRQRLSRTTLYVKAGATHRQAPRTCGAPAT
jgi:alanine dehydrogenase